MINERAESALFDELACELIANGRGFRFQAKGRSMLPAIEDGEILHLSPLGNRKLKLGDIVLLRNGAEFKAHRIIAKRGKNFVTRGDAGLEADAEITIDQVLGIITAKECCRTGRVVALRGVAFRSGFLLNEARKHISARLRGSKLQR